jgi:hypothetical protein
MTMKIKFEFETDKDSLKQIQDLKKPYQRIMASPPAQKYTIHGSKIYKAGQKKICGHCIAGNTYRTFERDGKQPKGASKIVEEILELVSNTLVKDLEKITTRKELHALSNKLRNKIHSGLKGVIKVDKIEPYNVCRKLVDLYIGHFVLLSADVSPSTRKRLLPLLFVPLDSQIIGKLLSHLGKVAKNQLSMRFPHTEVQYLNMQAMITELCNAAKLPASIAFDLLWNKRYEASGNDFLEVSVNAAKQ